MVAERLGESKLVTGPAGSGRTASQASKAALLLGRRSGLTIRPQSQLQAISDAPGALPGGTGARAHVRARSARTKMRAPPARTKCTKRSAENGGAQLP